MTKSIHARLGLMMFLEFFVWGSWFVTLGTYLGTLGFSGGEIGYTYLMNNIAAILSPFVIGMIADRFFSSQKVMAILHLAGGVVLYIATGIQDTGQLIGVLLLYNVCYMPTLALVNNISFQQITQLDQEFPKIRVWGTIGWIAAGLSITFLLSPVFQNVETTNIPMKMAAISSFLLAIYSFTLPNTPPQNKGTKVTVGDVLGFKALRLLKQKSFLVFAVCSLLISIPLSFYYGFTNLYLNDIGMEGAAARQSMGQMSEVLFMVLMPLFFVRLGLKKMLLVGMLAWVLRYILFALGDPGAGVWMLYGGILLHGICYDFFFVSGQIYVDRKAGPEIRASAQGFITLITYGVGIGLGSVLSGQIVDLFTVDGVKNWQMIWLIPAVFSLLVSILFVSIFKDDSKVSG